MSRLVACLIVRAFAADLDPYHLFQLGSAVRLGACGAAVEDDELVVFGGQFNDESVYYQDTLRFAINNSPRRFTASRVSQNLPERRQGAAMVPYDHNNLWLAGGSLGGFLLDGVMMFDTNLEIWMAGFPLESKKIPPREFHAATTTGDGKLLMWGGLGEGSRLYNDLHSVQMVGPETFMGDVVFPYRVEDLPQSGQVPTGRIKGSLTYVEGYLVLIGGISSDGLEQCDIHVFDLTESVWLKLNLPTNPSEKGLPIVTQNGKCFGKRQGHTAVRHGHSIYLIGGCNTEAKDYFCYDDLWQLTFTFDKQKLVSIRIQDRKQHPLNTGMQQVSAVLMKKQGLNHLPVLVQATGTGRGIEPSEEGVPYYLKTVVGRNLPLCADACSGHGWCDKGYCRCEAGFQGHDCGLVATAGLGNEAAGVCNYQGLMAPTGRCHCFHGYRGQFCQYGWAMCPGDCSGHGTCTHQARCDCSHGWEGLDCSVRARCPLECCNHGECSTEGKCDCFEGFFGMSCAISLTDRMGLQTAAQEAVDRLIQLAAAKDKESAEHETLAVELQAAVVGELSPVDQASREKKISDARMMSDELSQEADIIRDQSAQLLFKVQRDENVPKFFDNQNCQISLKPLIKLPGDSEAADAATLYKRQLLFSDMTSREQLNIPDETFWAEQARLGGYVPPAGRTEQGQLVDDQASPSRLQQTPPSSLLSVLALWLCMLATGVTWLIQSHKSRGDALIRDQEMTVYI